MREPVSWRDRGGVPVSTALFSKLNGEYFFFLSILTFYFEYTDKSIKDISVLFLKLNDEYFSGILKIVRY